MVNLQCQLDLIRSYLRDTPWGSVFEGISQGLTERRSIPPAYWQPPPHGLASENTSIHPTASWLWPQHALTALPGLASQLFPLKPWVKRSHSFLSCLVRYSAAEAVANATGIPFTTAAITALHGLTHQINVAATKSWHRTFFTFPLPPPKINRTDSGNSNGIWYLL